MAQRKRADKVMLAKMLSWYMDADRFGNGIVVPKRELEDMILELAKAEGYERRLPFETGDQYEKRRGQINV